MAQLKYLSKETRVTKWDDLGATLVYVSGALGIPSSTSLQNQQTWRYSSMARLILSFP